MKTRSRVLIALTTAAAALGLMGCNTVSTSVTPALGVPAFPPTPPDHVQVLTTPPTQPHIRLGEVQAQPSSTSTPAANIEAALQRAGARLGADAVVIVFDRTQIVGAVVTGPWWGRSVQSIPGRVVIGVAIKYIAGQ